MLQHGSLFEMRLSSMRSSAVLTVTLLQLLLSGDVIRYVQTFKQIPNIRNKKQNSCKCRNKSFEFILDSPIVCKTSLDKTTLSNAALLLVNPTSHLIGSNPTSHSIGSNLAWFR